MVRLLARVMGIGIETADMLVHEVLSRNLRDRRAIARYAGLTGSPDESGKKRREKGLARCGNPRSAGHDPIGVAVPHVPEGQCPGAVVSSPHRQRRVCDLVRIPRPLLHPQPTRAPRKDRSGSHRRLSRGAETFLPRLRSVDVVAAFDMEERSPAVWLAIQIPQSWQACPQTSNAFDRPTKASSAPAGHGPVGVGRAATQRAARVVRPGTSAAPWRATSSRGVMKVDG
jgi:hypothetical protein